MRIAAILLFLFIGFNTYGQEYYVTTADLNIREGSGVGYNAIHVLVIGDTIELLESTNGNWVNIKYKDYVGYVSKKYLDKIEVADKAVTDIISDQNTETNEEGNNSFFIAFFLIIAFAYFINRIGKKSRNKTTTALLSLFLGGFGMQYFYLNKITLGILSALFCWTFIPMFIGIIDSIRFATMKDEKFILFYKGNRKIARKTEQKRNKNKITSLDSNTTQTKFAKTIAPPRREKTSNYKFRHSKPISEDETIIDVSQENINLSIPQAPVNEMSSDKDFSTEVPYWQFSNVYSNKELNKATKAQKDFYQYFKNKILEGKFVDIQGNSNYAFILYYDLLDAYQTHKDIQLLERQFKLLGKISAPTKRYILHSLRFELSKRTDSYSIEKLKELENPTYLYLNNYSDYNPDLYKLGTIYKDRLSLDEKEVQWLNKIYRQSNVFLDIEDCYITTLKHYLLILKSLEERFLEQDSDLELEINYIKNNAVDRFKAGYEGWSNSYSRYYAGRAETEIFTIIFKRVENSVRESYGHTRKVSDELTSFDKDSNNEFDDKIGKVLNDVIREQSNKISPPDFKTQIELNAQNVNRWKREFNVAKNNFNSKNKELFIEVINNLEKSNCNNPNIENIFFDASRFITKYDKQQALIYYSKYVYYNIKSEKFKRKKLTKTAKRILFDTEDQKENFNKIISDLIRTRSIKNTLKQVALIYVPKRREIKLNPQKIQEAKERHKGTVALLNNYLQEEDPLESMMEEDSLVVSTEDTTISEMNMESRFIVGIKMNKVQEELVKNIVDNKYEIKQEEVEQYALQHGMFKNQLIDSINEACEEVLGGEALIEEEDDNYIIEESFYQEIIQINYDVKN